MNFGSELDGRAHRVGTYTQYVTHRALHRQRPEIKDALLTFRTNYLVVTGKVLNRH